jgi:aspartate kinase
MGGIMVSKFGGSSVANAVQIEKVRRIVMADKRRHIIVVSAPGKDANDTEKVTDHLFNLATNGEYFQIRGKDVNPRESHESVVGKFKGLIRDFAIEGDDIIEDLEADLNSAIEGRKRIDFFASRGEHYSAKVIARYFRNKGMQAALRLPEDIGFLVTERFGNAKILPGTYVNLKENLTDEGIIIIPGYYGITLKGDIAVLSRGGSDLTGGDVAYAMDAAIYENWTDTDGIFQVDPRIIPEAKVIPELTYKEIRLLSYRGFNVFHFDAMLNCKHKNIPINIRNTNNPDAPGTMIVGSRIPEETVVGIARMDGLAYVYIEKDMIGETIGFTMELLDIFKDFNINTHHYPTDMDDIAVIVDQVDLAGKVDDIKALIKQQLNPDYIDIQTNLSLLSPVGSGMKDTPGVLAKAADALYREGINIDVVDQGPSQMSFHFGINQKYGDAGLKALFKEMLRH